jgi:hypothetical protein
MIHQISYRVPIRWKWQGTDGSAFFWFSILKKRSLLEEAGLFYNAKGARKFNRIL